MNPLSSNGELGVPHFVPSFRRRNIKPTGTTFSTSAPAPVDDAPASINTTLSFVPIAPIAPAAAIDDRPSLFKERAEQEEQEKLNPTDILKLIELEERTIMGQLEQTKELKSVQDIAAGFSYSE